MSRKVLNLGSGAKGYIPNIFSGWTEIRVDSNPDSNPDLLADITDLHKLEDSCVDAVLMSHSLEHVYWHQTRKVIADIYRILNNDGFACIIVPDLQSLANYISDEKLHETFYVSPSGPITPHDVLFGYQKAIANGLFGMQHKCGFTAKSLQNRLAEQPFSEILVKRSVYDLVSVSSKCLKGITEDIFDRIVGKTS